MTIHSMLLLIFFVCSQNLSPQCQLCHEVVQAVQKHTPEKPFDTLFTEISVQVCVRKHIQDRTVCKGAVEQMVHSIINSAWKRLTDPHMVCHKIFLCPKEYVVRNLTEELQGIVRDKPGNTEWERATGRKTIRVMHISDLHPDLFYAPGAEADCDEPLCCRQLSKQNNVRSEVKKKAGYWGSLASCDLPLHTFDVFLEELKRLKLDFVIWTGDNTAHDIWQQSQSYNLNFTTILSNKIKQATNVTVLPAMGNHESFPVNVYDYAGHREDMLRSGLAENWRSWIGEQAYQMLKTQGYYSLTLDEYNDLKIIAINTQAGNDENWFLLRDPTDPGHMLQWLYQELKSCEQANTFAYVIGHIPPNNNMNEWAVRYNAIIDRFSYVVRGQFFGHTHNDHIGAHYSVNDPSRLVNYYLVAPSITTYDFRPPRYRVLDIDYDTLQIKNFYQYRLDLRKYQKKEDDPKFQLLYEFKHTYGLEDMRPQSGIKQFLQKLSNDSETQIIYSHMHGGGLEPGKPGRSSYCDTFAVPEDHIKCNGGQFKQDTLQKYGGPWRDLKH